MKRDLEAMAAREHDLLVIGGGIVGACVAWDASLRGLSVALVDKGDFSSGTSAGSSKLVHGGLRYLRNLEFSLIRESLRERRIWEIIAPHQVSPLPFMMPVGGSAGPGRWTLAAGLTLYDLLAYDRNRLADPDKRMPGHTHMAAATARGAEPVLAGLDLTGAMVYYDAQMLSPERIGLELIRAASERGALVANYTEVTDFLCAEAQIHGATVIDRLSGQAHRLCARMTVNAAGPWADRLLGLAQGTPSHTLVRSKGIHLITPALTRAHALTLTVPKEEGGGHLFVLPWRGLSIVGTTDTVFDQDPDALTVSERDIAGLLRVLNESLPGLKLDRDAVLHAYAGLRPLIDDGDAASESYKASRRAEVVDHEADDGLKGLVSAIGGKWTTARHIAEQVTNRVAARLGTGAPCRTDKEILPAGAVGRFADFVAAAATRYPTLPADRLAQDYGARLDEALSGLAGDPEQSAHLTPDCPEIVAQFTYAARAEMAMTLEDAVFRRTSLGMAGHPGWAALERAAQVMAPVRGWDADEIARQTTQAERLFYASERP